MHRKSRRMPRKQLIPGDSIIAAGFFEKRVARGRDPVPKMLEGSVTRRRMPGGFTDPNTPGQFFRKRVARGRDPTPKMLQGSARKSQPKPPPWQQYQVALGGAYRVADTDLKGFLLYVGSDGSPDFDADPAEVSATQPFTHTPTPPGSGSTKFHLVRRERDKYGLISQNTHEHIIEIDSNGDQVPLAPTGSVEVTLTDQGGGSVRVQAEYRFRGDQLNGGGRADQFLVYASVGSDPDPANDSPVATVTMGYLSTVALLDTTLTGYSDGDDLRVIVTTNRTSDSTQSENTTATTVPVDSDASALDMDGTSDGNVSGWGFHGDRTEQGGE